MHAAISQPHESISTSYLAQMFLVVICIQRNTVTMATSKLYNNSALCPVNPGIMNRPIRFKQTVETDNPKTCISQTLLANEVTLDRSSPIVECKQTKNSKVNGFQQTQTLLMVHCGLHALGVTNLNVVANDLLRTCFKS